MSFSPFQDARLKRSILDNMGRYVVKHCIISDEVICVDRICYAVHGFWHQYSVDILAQVDNNRNYRS